MAYNFNGSTTLPEYIDYGTRTQFYLTGDLSVGIWVKLKFGVRNDARVISVAGNFPPMAVIVKTPRVSMADYGIGCIDIKGGGFSFGLVYYPMDINPAYAWHLEQWLYFGFTRLSGTTYGYFGTRSALISAGSYTFGPGQSPNPITDGNGPLCVGNLVGGGIPGGAVELGPATYWGRPLIQSEHELLSKCMMPDTTDLLLRTRMDLGAADESAHLWPNTFHNSPLFVDETPCQAFSSGLDYGFYVA